MKASLILFLALAIPLSICLALGFHLNSFTLDEETNSYAIQVNYPHSGDKKTEELLRGYIDDYISSFKKEYSKQLNSNNKNVLNISYQKSAFSKDIVSYIFYIYTFTGGAHGNTSIITKTFNTQTLNELSLDDIFFEEENYLEKISKITINHLRESLIKRGATPDSIKFSEEWIDEGAGEKKGNYQKFTLTPREIIFHFEQYQVAPYSEGIQEVRIPFHEIDSILKAPFSKSKKDVSFIESERKAEQDCSWKDFHSEKLGLQIMIQSCNWQDMSPVFLESGNSIVQIPEKLKNSKKDGYKIIEVYKKDENEDFEELLNKEFISKLNRTEKRHCEVKQSYFILDDKSKLNYVIEPDNVLQETILQETPEGQVPRDPCGGYGISGNGFIRYFEYHPNESKTKYIFVRVGQDAPLFDEKSIKFTTD